MQSQLQGSVCKLQRWHHESTTSRHVSPSVNTTEPSVGRPDNIITAGEENTEGSFLCCVHFSAGKYLFTSLHQLGTISIIIVVFFPSCHADLQAGKQNNGLKGKYRGGGLNDNVKLCQPRLFHCIKSSLRFFVSNMVSLFSVSPYRRQTTQFLPCFIQM